jgi:hypothetical protein
MIIVTRSFVHVHFSTSIFLLPAPSFVLGILHNALFGLYARDTRFQINDPAIAWRSFRGYHENHALIGPAAGGVSRQWASAQPLLPSFFMHSTIHTDLIL